MFLEISGEWLPKAIEFIKSTWLHIAGSISIPLVIGFILKFIFKKIANKKTVNNAILSTTNILKDSVKQLEDKIEVFRNELKEFEDRIDNKIDNKFEELKEKRKEIYNNIMAGVDIIETKTKELPPIIDEIEQEVIEKQEEVIEKPIETIKIKKAIKKV